MNPYHELAEAKIELRQAKDHFETVRAIVEMSVVTLGKNAEDRKRELTVAVAHNDAYQAALSNLRGCEADLDRAQANIDAAEAERRDREWAIRAKLAEALERLHLPKASNDDIDWHDLHFQAEQRRLETVERDLRSPAARAQAQREMDEVFER